MDTNELKNIKILYTENHIGIRIDEHTNSFTFFPDLLLAGKPIHTITIRNTDSFESIQNTVRKLTGEEINIYSTEYDAVTRRTQIMPETAHISPFIKTRYNEFLYEEYEAWTARQCHCFDREMEHSRIETVAVKVKIIKIMQKDDHPKKIVVII